MSFFEWWECPYFLWKFVPRSHVIHHVKGELYDYGEEFCFPSKVGILIMVFITEAYVDLMQG